MRVFTELRLESRIRELEAELQICQQKKQQLHTALKILSIVSPADHWWVRRNAAEAQQNAEKVLNETL